MNELKGKFNYEKAFNVLLKVFKLKKENEYFDLKEDFFDRRSYSKNKNYKLKIFKLLVKYTLGFANNKGGFLIVGIKDDFSVKGIDYFIEKDKLIKLIDFIINYIKLLNIKIDYKIITVFKKDIFVFRIQKVKKKVILNHKYYLRINDELRKFKV